VRKLYTGQVAGCFVQIKTERLTHLKFLAIIAGKHANAQLRALKVGQNGNWAARFDLDLADNPVALSNLGVFAVAHVQAEHICTGIKKRPNHFLIAGSRAQGSNNLYVALTSHARNSSFGLFIGLEAYCRKC